MQSNHTFLDRYPRRRFIYTNLDPFDDVLDWIKGLRSLPLLTEVIQSHPAVRDLAKPERAERLGDITSHIRAAVEYLEAALITREPISFLPMYYGLLNLAKSMVLLGAHAPDLRSQLHHGLVRPPFRESPGLLKDRIEIKKKGAVPLLYRTLTSELMPKTNVTLDDVYRHIDGIGYEYGALAGRQSALAFAKLEIEKVRTEHRLLATLTKPSQFSDNSRYKHVAFANMRRAPGQKYIWRSPLYST